jgi:hypothetical protein
MVSSVHSIEHKDSVGANTCETNHEIVERLTSLESDMDCLCGQMEGVINLLNEVYNLNNKIYKLVDIPRCEPESVEEVKEINVDIEELDTSYIPHCVSEIYITDDNTTTLVDNHLNMVVSLPGRYDGDLFIYPFGSNSSVKLDPMDLSLSFSSDNDRYGICRTEITSIDDVSVMKVISYHIDEQEVGLDDLSLPITFRYDGDIAM